MDRNALWKWLILILMIAASIAIIYPPSQKVVLGLDLRGGTSFTVEIDKEAIKERILEKDPDIMPENLPPMVNREARQARENALEVIRNRVDGIGIAEPSIYPASHKDAERIIVQLPGIGEDKQKEARDAIESVAFLEFRLVHKNSAEWTKILLDEGKSPKGFKISQDGENYVRDSSQLKDEEMDKAYYEELRKYEPRARCEFMLEKDTSRDGHTIYRPYYIERRRQLTGEAVKKAGVEYHPVTSAAYVTLEFDKTGAKLFARVTRDYAPNGANNRDSEVGRQLAIVLDGTLYSAPVIRQEIPDGSAQITGQFTAPVAMRLANVLTAGALPAPVKIVQVSQVSPSLGRDAIVSGSRAAILAGLAVLVFMLIYYMRAGLIADIALILDIILLPLGLVVASGFLGMASGGFSTKSMATLPTLTLPGIAGIVLTIGMAVDANVLIFERIREELKSSKRLLTAIEAGYDKAFSTIFDANITTLLTAVILFLLGSGPVRGFAVTLSAGIIVSMIVVLVYTRMFFEFMAMHMRNPTLKMLSVIRETHIDFIGMRKFAVVLSLVVIAGSWTMTVMRGKDNFGVDFAGGSALMMTFEQRVDTADLRKAMSAAGLEAHIQYQKENLSDNEYLEIRVGEEQGDQVKEVIDAEFSDAGFTIVKEDEVGGQIGAEMRRKGVLAIVWALVGIIVYITVRFEFSFAVAAIVALAHDVLVTIGIYCLLGRQLSLPVIAALLTIVGYSVNDTIVVFDRIREDLKLIRGKPYKDIANLSINQTLSRTVLTSLTTLLSVVVLLLFGGGAINDFALTLFIGVIVGTYSSIFVATPVTLLWHREKAKAVKAVKAAKA
ncbi:MAG: protein translocase subunit SecD [Spartobacteria bacterium]|nr:protein translocase subunit SecD [Spartobacteria bacterium]